VIRNTAQRWARRVPTLKEAQRRMAENPRVLRDPRHLARPGGDGPLVTVITAVRDNAGTLGRCLQSVQAQGYGPVEHVVVDGGSTDGTLEIIHRHADRIAALVSERDAGISDAFNRGLGLARGEIIGLLNADDWYEPDAVGQAVGALGAHPEAGIACGRLRYWRGDRPDVEFPSQPERLGVDMTVNHPTLFVRRSVYERIGLFRPDLHLAMDYELVLRARRLGVRFVSVDRVLANMSWEGASDRRWRQTLGEVARVVHDLYPRDPWMHALLLFKLSKATTARALEAAGLSRLTRLYRERISRFRRSYPD
jgi:glycosyltransferase involved in cell wall biosynthesis